ncbi:hypothetical protein LINPERHAP2_LOCUS26754 [Linum perenne]
MHSQPLLNSVASPITINPHRRCFFTNGFPNPSFLRRRNRAFPAVPSLPLLTRRRNFPSLRSSAQDTSDGVKGGGGEEDLELVIAVRSQYNHIAIVDTPSARVLLLDSTHSIHSILQKDQKWTDSYWDEFASLPPIVPEGPISILGLGGGTAAHLMLHLWPSLQLEGWEIDEILIDKARMYFGLSDLEKNTPAGGCLHVCIGDALQSTENDYGRYAACSFLCALIPSDSNYSGIIVDLFNEGKVLPQLEQVSTWLELKRRLMTNGRIMVNCAGIHGHGTSDAIDKRNHLEGKWAEHAVIKAMHEAFPSELSWKRMPDEKGANYLALTGPLPDLSSWSATVPDELSESVKQWRSCSFVAGATSHSA